MAGKQPATLLTGGNMHVADRRYKTSSQRIMAGSQRRSRYMLLEQAGDETSISEPSGVEEILRNLEALASEIQCP